MPGGYEDGYQKCACFWGENPGSLIPKVLRRVAPARRLRVLDAGCGEGKNAAAFAKLGHEVHAVDCSATAINNGRAIWGNLRIMWYNQDIALFEMDGQSFDIVMAYGLFHCLESPKAIRELATRLKAATVASGFHVICAFNDRRQDLSGHPGFRPLLERHSFYVDLYKDWEIVHESDSDLLETHPHNNIRHSHSMTRIIARRC